MQGRGRRPLERLVGSLVLALTALLVDCGQASLKTRVMGSWAVYGVLCDSVPAPDVADLNEELLSGVSFTLTLTPTHMIQTHQLNGCTQTEVTTAQYPNDSALQSGSEYAKNCLPVNCAPSPLTIINCGLTQTNSGGGGAMDIVNVEGDAFALRKSLAPSGSDSECTTGAPYTYKYYLLRRR